MMQPADVAFWDDRVRETLDAYDDDDLRNVAAQQIKVRQASREELIDKVIANLSNPVVVDRRLKDLDPIARRLLALMERSRQPLWRLASLLQMLVAIGSQQPLPAILTLFEAGLLFPDPAARLGRGSHPIKSYLQAVSEANAGILGMFAHPLVLARTGAEDLGLPGLAFEPSGNGSVQEADGLEWLLRLAAVWQQIGASPLRRTQHLDFFKRDLDRLRSDPLLCAAPTVNLADVPDPGLLAVALAEAVGVLQDDASELRPARIPAEWEEGLTAASVKIWMWLPQIDTWRPDVGWIPSRPSPNPFPAAYLLCFALLAQLKSEQWANPEEIEEWIVKHHPFWSQDGLQPSRRKSWLPTFLLGLAFPLRWIQVLKDQDGTWLVRLSPLGRWLIGLGEVPPQDPAFSQTLVVQPNLEIIVYRQGLTPALIAHLSRFAAWKSFGSACTLQLDAESIYRGLESGLTFEAIIQMLERHGTRSLPSSVVESLRTWADKRERLTVFSSATLFEFGSAGDLEQALTRGLPGIRLSDRLLAVPNEQEIDYRHFRLAGTRDYSLPPERCVEVAEDGVTLSIDLTRSDLLLETEIERFAEALDQAGVNGKRRYCLTPASLSRGRESGMGVHELEEWFYLRTGQSLSPSARLLINGSRLPDLDARRQLVIHVADTEIADGLLQWPATRPYIAERLGPTALVVAEENLTALAERLGEIGARLVVQAIPARTTERIEESAV
jgi:hypothetical protein